MKKYDWERATIHSMKEMREGPNEMFQTIAIRNLREVIKKNDDNEDDYCNYEYCSHCPYDESCCQQAPCELSPSDLNEVNEENIIALLNTGAVVIDWWEGDLNFLGYDEYPKVYYLRMRAVPDISSISPGWWGQCYAFTSGGCLLDFHHRPYYGRRMEYCGKPDKEHIEYSSKQEAAIEWRPYHDLLKKVIEDYDDIPFMYRPD